MTARRSLCIIIASTVLLSIILVGEAFVSTTSDQISRLQRYEKRLLGEDFKGDGFDVGRRHVLGTFLAPIFISPASSTAKSLEVTAVEPDLDCLLDLPPLKKKSFVRIYLCRHGHTENNRLRKVQGARVDPPINDTGVLQAINLGKALARAHPSPMVFFSSTLQRAKKTAKIAASQIDFHINPKQLDSLNEVDFGPIAEGRPVALARVGMQATYASWAVGNIDYRPKEGGDSGRDVIIRAAESIRALAIEAKATDNGCVAAITHSTLLRILIGMVMDEPLLESASRQVVNGGVTVIDVPTALTTRSVGAKPNFLGGVFSQVPQDFQIEIPACSVIRVNESRHLPSTF